VRRGGKGVGGGGGKEMQVLALARNQAKNTEAVERLSNDVAGLTSEMGALKTTLTTTLARLEAKLNGDVLGLIAEAGPAAANAYAPPPPPFPASPGASVPGASEPSAPAGREGRFRRRSNTFSMLPNWSRPSSPLRKGRWDSRGESQSRLFGFSSTSAPVSPNLQA
jgi:hypothetical protein